MAKTPLRKRPPHDPARRKERGLLAVGASLPTIAAPALRKRGFAQARLITEWPAIVGDMLARETVPQKLVFPRGSRGDGVLHLRVSSGFALELQHIAPQLIERINGFFGYGAVADSAAAIDAARAEGDAFAVVAEAAGGVLLSIAEIPQFAGVETLFGTDGDDVLTPSGSVNVVEGGDGDDVIRNAEPGAAAGDTPGAREFFGEAGDDRFEVNVFRFDESFDGGAGDDTIDFSALETSGLLIELDRNPNQVSDENGDQVTLNDIETVIATSGDDTIFGSRTEKNVVFGGDGDDTFDNVGDRGGAELYGGAGDDSVRYADSFDVNVPGAPQITGLLFGGAGDDSFIAAGVAVIDGGDDEDTAGFFGAFDDFDFLVDESGLLVTSREGAFTETAVRVRNVERFSFSGQTLTAAELAALIGVTEDDVLGRNITVLPEGEPEPEPDPEDDAGGADVPPAPVGENDDLALGGGDDVRQAGAGDDTVAAGRGDDTVFGGAGDDLLFGDNGDDRLTGGAGFDTLRGGAGTDRLIGKGGEDRLFGGGGDDDLRGGGGADTLTGGGGGDTLKGGGGDDLLLGKAGDDRLFGGDGDDDLRGGAGDDTLAGAAGDDRLIGSVGADRLAGQSGADTLLGGGGRDALNGGDGADALSGQAGADTLLGGAGGDRLEGGAGDDLLSGGPGADVFVFARGAGSDVIRGHQQDLDLIEIGAGANRFADLEITQDGADVLIAFANVEITVENATAAAFNSDDFIFT